MGNLSEKEEILIGYFLKVYREMLNDEVNVPFNPRNVTIVSQPDMRNEKLFHWVSYNKWFDELPVQADFGTSSSLLGSFLDAPINILIQAEELGRSLLSKKDHKKIIKALKLLDGIKIERQHEKD
jgi:hypothetical protein